MSRYPQQAARRGSQKWLQLAVQQRCPELVDPIATAIQEPADRIEWLSPVGDDDFAEYRDQAFVDRLGLELGHRSIGGFWPTRGPQWDGLARTSSGQVVLIEAKAHIPEMVGNPTGATGQSRQLIEASLNETRAHLGVTADVDWSRVLYQHNNRLAHLYLLRELNDVPAWLVFVNFYGDEDVGGPVSADAWMGASTLAKKVLGWPSRHPLMRYVLDLNVDVKAL